MKFTLAVVVLAFALGANSSIIPGGPLVVGGPWGGSVVVGPSGPAAITVAASPLPVHSVIAGHGSVAIQASAVPAVVGGHVVAGPGPVQVVSGPHHAVVGEPAVVAAAHAVVPGGTFVAKTRGAVHVAPLAGHVQSVFTLAVVVLAFALGANSSIIPGGPLVVGGPWGGSVVVGPSGPAAITVAASPLPVHSVIAGHGSVAIQASAVPAVVGGHVVAGPGPVQVVSGPHHAVVGEPAVVAAAHAVVPGGTFVAKTRGAVHVAPLAGHVQSVVSANLQPAPGTH